MILPPPLVVTLKEGVDGKQQADIIRQIEDLDHVIHALPREKGATPRELTVIYNGGAPRALIEKIEGVAEVKEGKFKPNQRPKGPGF
jgi:hypothetical protein